jgi:hypothetical protein
MSNASEEAARLSTLAGENAATAITGAGESAATGVEGAADAAATEYQRAATSAATGVTDAARDASTGYRLSADEANGLLRSIYGDAVTSLEPYRAGGSEAFTALQQGIAPGGEFSQQFNFEADPGYQFRMAEGQKALERSAAARGGLQSGATLKALTRYSQGVASDEYSKAFDRFRTTQNDRFSRLSQIAGTGLQATQAGINVGDTYGGRAAGNVMASGEYGGNMLYRGASEGAQYGYRGATDGGTMRYRGAADGGQFRLSSIGQAGNFRMEGTRQANDALTGGASSRAAGTVGSSNAWRDMAGNLGSIGGELARRIIPGRQRQPQVATV